MEELVFIIKPSHSLLNFCAQELKETLRIRFICQIFLQVSLRTFFFPGMWGFSLWWIRDEERIGEWLTGYGNFKHLRDAALDLNIWMISFFLFRKHFNSKSNLVSLKSHSDFINKCKCNEFFINILLKIYQPTPHIRMTHIKNSRPPFLKNGFRTKELFIWILNYVR